MHTKCTSNLSSFYIDLSAEPLYIFSKGFDHADNLQRSDLLYLGRLASQIMCTCLFGSAIQLEAVHADNVFLFVPLYPTRLATPTMATLSMCTCLSPVYPARLAMLTIMYTCVPLLYPARLAMQTIICTCLSHCILLGWPR